MTVHLLRETAHQAGATFVHTACSHIAWRLKDAPLASFVTGAASRVTCPDCRERPVPWQPWKKDQHGTVRDLGEIRMVA